MIIRPVTRADYACLGKIMYDAVHLGGSPYSAAQRRAWMPHVPCGPAWEQRLSRQIVYVAQEAKMLCGFMSLDAAEVDLAFILPAQRGTGLFRKLYLQIESWACVHNRPRLTTYASLTAQPAFAAVGFKVQHHEEVLRGQQRIPRAFMVKGL